MNNRQFRRQASQIKAKPIAPDQSLPIKNALLSQVFQRVPYSIRTHPKANNVLFALRYRDITGKAATLDGMIALLSQLNVNDVLRTVATLNNRNCMDVAISHQELHAQQVNLIQQLFSTNFQKQIFASAFGQSLLYSVFHRSQQLFVLRYALMVCQHDKGRDWNEDSQNMFAEACLMASDLLDADTSSDGTEDANILMIKIMVKTFELANDNVPLYVVARAMDLWHHIPEELANRRKLSISIANEFEEVNSIDIMTFMQVLYMLIAQSMRTDEPDANPWSRFVINTKTFSTNTSYSEETILKVMTVVSCTLSTIKNEIAEWTANRHGYAPAPLERYPMIQLNDHLFVFYDRKLLLRYFTWGIWWNINDALSEEKRGRFRADFGQVFETYINRVLAHACDASTKMRLYNTIRFNSTDEICDALIETNNAWILFETKASLLNHKSKYSDDTTALTADLIKRFWGDERASKGAGQLARSIKRLLNGERDTAKRLAIDVRESIYPILVSYDTTVCNKSSANLLDNLIRIELGRLPLNIPCVRPLTILSGEDVEAITTLSYRYTLPELLDSYHLKSAPLSSFKSHIMQKYQKEVAHDRSYSMINYSLLHEQVAMCFSG